MKVILDIKNDREDFFMELLRSLNYVTVVSEIRDKDKSRQVQDLIEAFEDVKLHEAGKKSLKSAKDLLDEL